MKVSFNWIRELCEGLPEDLDADAAARLLTLQGFEVEGVLRRGREVAGVVVAEVVARARPHPQADKLRLVRVRAGGVEVEVVCGAANVPGPGGRVAWARPGARLPGGGVIAAREVRGVLSPGMLCSEAELGLADRSDGILVMDAGTAPGADAMAALGAVDDVFEVNVTPNRADALSHLGIARELVAGVGARLGARARLLPAAPPAAPVRRDGPTFDVRIDDGGACPRYLGRCVVDLSVAPSPGALRTRLAACGVRPISNLVDVTNYVLLETGHPLHAFDLDKLEGGIVVRRARAGETMVTLDGQERALEPEDIVIADGRGPVALAGVMGGATSEIGAGTRRVFLEAATFDAVSVRRTSRRLGLASEASYRFERGVDPEGVPHAAARAAFLLAALGGGAVAGAHVDRYPAPRAPRTVVLPLARLARVTGGAVDAAAARAALVRVAERVDATGQGGAAALAVTVPSFRPDLAIAEDLIEEVLRLSDGYQSEARVERVRANAVSEDGGDAAADRARDALATAGLSEIVSWAFVSRAALAAVAGGDPALGDGVAVKNPISSDYEVMRTSLLPGLAAVLARNLARGAPSPALFEVGPVIRRAPAAGAEPVQATMAAGLMAGHAPDWLNPEGRPLDFYDAKAALMELLAAFGVGAEVPTFVRLDAGAAPAAPFLHPGAAAAVALGSERIGWVGEVHPKVARALGVETRALYFEAAVAPLARRLAERASRPNPPPRFPAITRDVSFWIAREIAAAAQSEALRSAGEPLLVDLAPREEFLDPKYAPPGHKGMLWSLTYRAADRTLTDEEVDAAHARVVAALRRAYEVRIR